MYFDSTRAKARLGWWRETLIEVLNTNMPREMSDEVWHEPYEDEYLKRIEKPAKECLDFARDVLTWPTPHLGGFIAKYAALVGTMLFTPFWFLLLFVLINLESAVKLVFWSLALVITLFMIVLCDVRLEPRANESG